MAGKSKFPKAEQLIKSFFAESGKRVYTRKDIERVYEYHYEEWKLPIAFNTQKFFEAVVQGGVLRHILIDLEGYKGGKELYLTEEAGIFEIGLKLFPNSYLSHYTAAFIHQLTNQFPKTVYVTFEQTAKAERAKTDDLEQKNIDAAFQKPQRKSGLRGRYEDYTIVGHNGMYTNLAGVYIQDDLPVTNIERTLIDLTVRPAYGGGVHEVLKAYTVAKGRVSVNKLMGILSSINFTYPYSQAIGFYLERAGYDGKFLDAVKQKNSRHNFYLAYEIAEKEYSSDWKLYYPKGM